MELQVRCRIALPLKIDSSRHSAGRQPEIADDSQGNKLPTNLKFLLNFLDELRRKAPVQ